MPIIIQVGRVDGKTWTVKIHQPGLRGPMGFPHFVKDADAKKTADGVRACFLKLGIPVECNYTTEKTVNLKNAAENPYFREGVHIFCTRFMDIQDKEDISSVVKTVTE